MKNNHNPFKKEDKFTNKFNSQSQNLSFKDPHKKNIKYDPTNNSFNKSNSQQKLDNSIKETPIELNNKNLFPYLVPIKQNTQTNIECNKFKHILTNTPINDESPKTHIIPLGCVEITRVLQKYVYEYGTTSFIQKEEEELIYSMNNTIDKMKKKWEKYENVYDHIHGDGVYANNFRLPPLRDDSISEEQNNSDEYNSDEYNSDEYQDS